MKKTTVPVPIVDPNDPLMWWLQPELVLDIISQFDEEDLTFEVLS